MTESQLLELFRRALKVSLGVPLVAAVGACSSSTTGTAPTPDAHEETPDAHHEALVCKKPASVCPATIPVACIDASVPDAAFITADDCTKICPAKGGTSCVVQLADGGVPVLQCFGASCGNGRAYAGMERPRAPGQTSPVGRFFAETAQLEAASVDAFRILRDELRAHDAPADLTASAEVAARDEVRHARVTRRLARRYGPVTPHVRAGARPVRPLDAVAEENAVEGCVRETYAALLAHHQALVATDPEVRDAMTAIAADETRHAALAWRVAAWVEPKLDAASRARVGSARAAAVRELRETLGATVPVSLAEIAGVPPAERAARMFAVLEAELF